MRLSARPFQFVAGLLLGGSLLAGCKQGLNERCEVTTDCESQYICQDVNNEGICVFPGTALPDSGAADAQPGTPGADAGAIMDAAFSDARADAIEAGPDAISDSGAPTPDGPTLPPDVAAPAPDTATPAPDASSN
jgi:hypothetical protein